MLVIFDCDGVLVDSEALACQVDADLLTELGIPYTRDEIIRQFVGVSLKDMIARIERRPWLHVAGRFRRNPEPHPLRALRERAAADTGGSRGDSGPPPSTLRRFIFAAGTDRLLAPAHRARRLVRAHLQRQRSRAGQACAGFVPACCRAHGNASRAMPRHRGFDQPAFKRRAPPA